MTLLGTQSGKPTRSRLSQCIFTSTSNYKKSGRLMTSSRDNSSVSMSHTHHTHAFSLAEYSTYKTTHRLQCFAHISTTYYTKMATISDLAFRVTRTQHPVSDNVYNISNAFPAILKDSNFTISPGKYGPNLPAYENLRLFLCRPLTLKRAPRSLEGPGGGIGKPLSGSSLLLSTPKYASVESTNIDEFYLE